ncbi:MAG: hypothetical protein PUG33_07620 [Mollicutes bacterium]|nr:hypothetical protein [Mollicutes bacterium]
MLEKEWKIYCKKSETLLIEGLEKGLISLYDDKLIKKLRNIYYGGVPASIILLSDAMTNGYCYDRAFLLARAFLDEDDDINLIYATVDSLRLNPEYICDAPLYADHCIVSQTTKDGRHLIYDTSTGFVYDKEMYWLIENPKIRKIDNKESIRKFLLEEERINPSCIKSDKYIARVILPMLEEEALKEAAMYSAKGIGLLQREIEHYKQEIGYTTKNKLFIKTDKN